MSVFIIIFDNMKSAMSRHCIISVIAGNIISFSSCKSLLYPNGRLVVNNAISFGMDCSLLHFPRIISNTSGFFLCGIMLDPVVSSSGKEMNPKFWHIHIQISIERRPSVDAMAEIAIDAARSVFPLLI